MENAAACVKAGCGALFSATIGRFMKEKNEARAERLAEALRANLRRRKAQARDRDAPGADAAEGTLSPSPTETEAPSRSRP